MSRPGEPPPLHWSMRNVPPRRAAPSPGRLYITHWRGAPQCLTPARYRERHSMDRLVLAAALSAVLTPCQGFNIDRERSTTFQDPARGFEQSVVQFRTDLEERLLFIYPWTQRYFSNIGSLPSVAAILGDPNVKEYGKKILTALEGALKNMDNIKSTLAHLSKLHAEKLHVDPQNFKLRERRETERLLGDGLMIDLGLKLGALFNPSVQAAWEKFLGMVHAVLSKHYH